MVNSWGTAGGGRPNGIFRLDMNMNYDCTMTYYGSPMQTFYWQTLDIDFAAVAQPDLVVLGIETDPAEPDPGETVDVHVTVKNQGAADAGGFVIDWYADLAAPPLPYEVGDRWESVTSLAAGATYTMSATYTYSTTGIYNMYAQVDTDQQVTESNEGNNVLGPVSIVVGPCECDLNHDGRCDMQDWLLFGEDWGRTDCPIPFSMNATKKVAPNNNISGDPDEKAAEAAPVFRVRKVEKALPDGDQPVRSKGKNPSNKGRSTKGAAPATDTDRAPRAQAVFAPIWSRLDKLALTDKENAVLQLEVASDLDTDTLNEVKSVESLWNSGMYAGAMEALQTLEAGGVAVAAGISWKTPKAVGLEGLTWFEGDVRIGAREDIMESHLDFDAETGNLFAVLRYHDPASSNYYWSVNISTNNGQTWQETYEWWASFEIKDASAAVVADYLYVGYVHDTTFDSARIRRCSVSDGQIDGSYGWHEVFDSAGDPIKEIALVTNTDSWDNRVYYLAILDSNALKWYWTDQDGGTGTLPWFEVATGVNHASHGLDATWNEGYQTGSLYHLYVSFVSTNSGNPLYVWRYSDTQGAEAIEVEPDPYPYTPTGISAYDDNIITVFEYRDASNNPGIKYWISYNGGDTWLYNYIAQAQTGKYFWNPDVAARKGGGIGVVYQEEVGEPDPCWYRYRSYDGSIWWTDPEQYNEIDVVTGSLMEMESLPPLPGNSYAFGSIWKSWTPDGAFFDRSDGAEAEPCECDLNHDGRCDMQDWLLFGEDWGRTDCPSGAENIAPLATASSSGGGQSVLGYGPENMNDGVSELACSMHWVSGGSTPAGEWIQLTWGSPVTVQKMGLATTACETQCDYSAGRNLGYGTIQYWNGTSWVTDGSVSNMIDDWSYTFSSPVTTTAVRIYGVATTPSCAGYQRNPIIFEWYVYGETADGMDMLPPSIEVEKAVVPEGVSPSGDS